MIANHGFSGGDSLIYSQIQTGVNNIIWIRDYAVPDPISAIGELTGADADDVIVRHLDLHRASLTVHYPAAVKSEKEVVESKCRAIRGEIFHGDGEDVQEEGSDDVFAAARGPHIHQRPVITQIDIKVISADRRSRVRHLIDPTIQFKEFSRKPTVMTYRTHLKDRKDKYKNRYGGKKSHEKFASQSLDKHKNESEENQR